MTISEDIKQQNQELELANNHVASLEQRIAFKDKGKRGKYIAELTKVKKERDKILSNINRTGDVIETNDLIKLKKVDKKDFYRLDFILMYKIS